MPANVVQNGRSNPCEIQVASRVHVGSCRFLNYSPNNYNMKPYHLLLLLTLILSACNNPMDKKYNDSTLEQDGKLIRESKKLSEEDAKLMAAYMMRAKLNGEDLSKYTYAEILDKAKDFRAEQRELSETLAKEQEEKRARLGQTITVALFDIGYQEADYEDYIYYEVAFQNNTSKDIKAVKGSISITDLFDDEIKLINVVFDEGIKGNQVYKTTYTTDYNQFRDEDKQLRSKTINEIKYTWTPEKILFSDGTSLE